MANIKRVNITGVLPFDMNDDDELIRVLGYLNMPLCGLKISWKGDGGFVPNVATGGQTMMTRFALEGEEAVNFAFLDRFIKLVKKVGGKIDRAFATDIENKGSGTVNLEYPDIQPYPYYKQD